MRTELQSGTMLALRCDGVVREYCIEHTIGEGASCIAYEAVLANGSNTGLRCRIKECYPYNAAIMRQGTALIWANADEREHAFAKLRLAHNLLLQLKNDAQLGDSLVISNLCEGNGTLYIVMEINHALTYDQVHDESLQDILETTRVLASHVGQLHNKGYLHLDIKPSNFLVKHRPSTMVWLFDVDSFTSMDDIAHGSVVSYPFSRTNAAPEQLCGKNKKLCPATDIFAIGSILFSKLMGRSVYNEDMGLFPEWSFDEPIFENVNPQVIRGLETIFQKTLAASIKRRYQNVPDLLEAINQTMKCLDEPYIESNCPPVSIEMLGREGELQRIHNEFSSGKRAIFLHGFGGIGKSTIAVAYGNRFAKEYSAVLFLKYRTSLQDSLDEVAIQNFDGNENEKRKVLQKLLIHDTLVIIDNFDIPIDGDEYFDELLKLKAYLLVTTRTDFSSVYSGMISQIEIGILPHAQQEILFQQESKYTCCSEYEKMILKKILRRIEGHTFAIVLYAKQMLASGWTLNELQIRMDDGFNDWIETAKIRYSKDEKRNKATLPAAISVLFRIADLSDDMKRVLRNIYVLSCAIEVDKTQYKRFICADIIETKVYDNSEECWRYSFQLKPHKYTKDIEILNELEERGYIGTTLKCYGLKRVYTLHPLVEDLIVEELKADNINCPQVYSYINALMHVCVNPCDSDEAEEAMVEAYQQFLCHFLSNANCGINCNLELAIRLMTEIGTSPLWYPFSMVYKKLEWVLKNYELESACEFEIQLVLFVSWLFEYRNYYRAARSEELYHKREQNLLRCFEDVTAIIKKLTGNAREKAIKRLRQAIANEMNTSCVEAIPVVVMNEVLQNSPDMLCLSIDRKKVCEIPLTEDEIAEESARKQRIEQDETWQDYLEDKEWREMYEDDFREAEDKVEFIKSIIVDNSYDDYPSLRIEAIDACVESLFLPIRLWRDYDKAYYERIGWDVIVEILEIEKAVISDSHLASYIWKNGQKIINRLISYAMVNDITKFKEEIQALELEMQSNFERIGFHWTYVVTPEGLSALELLRIAVHSLILVRKSSLIFPYLYRIVEKCEAYARKQKDFKERDLYSLYRFFVECAEEASYDDTCDKKTLEMCSRVEHEYSEKIEKITGITYELKWNPNAIDE